MKTVIVYCSTHHGNTRRLVEAIAKTNEVTLVDVVAHPEEDLSGYDRIGIASGIAFGKYYPQMMTFIEKNLPSNKDVFFIHSAGDPRENHRNTVKAIADQRGCKTLGTYFCKGFDTFGPFKLIGGINKQHPTEEEIQDAVRFYQNLPH